jgi:hypothetical protein
MGTAGDKQSFYERIFIMSQNPSSVPKDISKATPAKSEINNKSNDKPAPTKSKINVRRSEEHKLIFPERKSQPLDNAIIERTHLRDGKEHAKLLKRLGARLVPEGTRHMASFCVHVYLPSVPEASGSVRPSFVCQSASPHRAEMPELLAQLAMTELGAYLMRLYGRKVPKNLNQKVFNNDLGA